MRLCKEQCLYSTRSKLVSYHTNHMKILSDTLQDFGTKMIFETAPTRPYRLTLLGGTNIDT
jgi:hypothetical protein